MISIESNTVGCGCGCGCGGCGGGFGSCGSGGGSGGGNGGGSDGDAPLAVSTVLMISILHCQSSKNLLYLLYSRGSVADLLSALTSQHCSHNLSVCQAVYLSVCLSVSVSLCLIVPLCWSMSVSYI